MFGVLDSATGWTARTYQQTANSGGPGTNKGNGSFLRSDDGSNSSCNFLLYTSTNSGVSSQDQNILEIDLQNMYSSLGLSQSQCYSIYVYAPIGENTNNSAYAQDSTVADVGVWMTNTDDLGLFTKGYSVVSPQRVFLTGNFNNGGSGQTGTTGTKVATSVYTPDLRYGIDGIPAQIVWADFDQAGNSRLCHRGKPAGLCERGEQFNCRHRKFVPAEKSEYRRQKDPTPNPNPKLRTPNRNWRAP